MSAKFKSINSFYGRSKLNKDKGIFNEDSVDMQAIPDQVSRLLRSNKSLRDERDHESFSEISEIRSDEVAEASGADDMTLMELQVRCKARKGKVKRSLAMPAMTDSSLPQKSKNGHLKVHVSIDVDLTEPLISFKRKPSKRCGHKENIAKSRKLSLLDSPSSSSITTENNMNLDHLSHVKMEIMENDEGSHLGECLPLSPQHAKSEPEVVSYSHIQSGYSSLDFMNQQDAVQTGIGAENFLSKPHLLREETISISPKILEEPDDNVVFLVKEESDVTNGGSHEEFPDLQNGSFGISDDENKTGDTQPSDLSNETHLMPTTNDELRVSMELPARPSLNDRSIGSQGTEMDHFFNGTIFSGSEDAHQNFRITSCKSTLDGIINMSSPFMSENHDGSNSLQSLGDDSERTGANPTGVRCSNAIPLSVLTFSMEPTHLGLLPTSEGSGCCSSTDGDSAHASGTYSESNAQYGQDCVTLQMDHISDGCDTYIGGSHCEDMLVTDMPDAQIISTYNPQFRGDQNGDCLSIADAENRGLVSNLSEETGPGILKDAAAMPSCEVMASSTDTPMETAASPHIASNMLCITNKCDSEAAITHVQMVDSLLNIEGCREIEEHDIHPQHASCSYRSLSENLLSTSVSSPENVSSKMLDSDFANTSCRDIQEHIEKTSLTYCEDIKPMQPPKRLPSSRKVFSPTLREKLYQALDAEEFYENMRYYRNSRRICFDKWTDSSLSTTECKGTESKSNIENAIGKPGTACHTKGILKPANNQSLKGCSNPLDNSSATSQSQDAIKFSQRQMRDIDCITEKLLSVVQTMKSVMQETLNLEEFSSTYFKSTADKMITAIESAGAVEATTGKYISMMNRDLKRFCKIMRSKENDATDKADDVPKKRKKITFADEAGGMLCHVKVLEEPYPFAVES